MFDDDFFYDAIWVADWPIGPIGPLVEPDTDPWRVAQAETDLLEEALGADGLWPFVEEVGRLDEAALAEFMTGFEDALKDLESEDRLGNHEIQRLMQMMNQNDTLEANVRKKMDDTANAIIGKI